MQKSDIPKSHPRYHSLVIRDLLKEGVEAGITSLQGLTAHGRGEAFDYLLGEKTLYFAKRAVKAAASTLILAKYPVFSVNGNTAVLAARELIELSRLTLGKLEINLFHASKNRERKIYQYLTSFGATDVLLPDKTTLTEIDSNRRMISSFGQAKADVIFVPLEDGDRTEALRNMGKKVITIDLNPLSRTAKTATITIIDNIIRCMPLLVKEVRRQKNYSVKQLLKNINQYDNRKVLSESLYFISRRLILLGKR